MTVRTLQWRGLSGTAYEYDVHGLDFEPQAGLYGNYIFARETPIGWYAVYIGQGELRSKILNHPTGKQARKKATNVHVRINGNDAPTRVAEVQDLRAAHDHASTTILFRPT